LAAELADHSHCPTIRFDVGTDDHQLPYNRQFHARLDELGIPHEYAEVGGGHEWRFVNRQLPATLNFVTHNSAPVAEP
jgi:S-formylglutathione hydrolase FrmB